LTLVNGLIDTLLGGGDVAKDLLATFCSKMGNFQAAVAAALFEGLGFARAQEALLAETTKTSPPASLTRPLGLGAAQAPTNEFTGMVQQNCRLRVAPRGKSCQNFRLFYSCPTVFPAPLHMTVN
jgi:hypothetical protein